MLIYLDSAQNRQGRAQREFRARGDGALHARRGPLHRAGRQGGRARVHRLEPRPRDRARSCSAAPARRRRARRCSARRGASTATRCSTSCSRSRRPPSSRHRQAVARVRLARARSAPRSNASRDASASRTTTSRRRCCAICSPRTRSTRRTTAARWSSRRSSSSSARCASSRSTPARDAAVRGRRGRHGPEPVLAAQRQGLARRRAWINIDTLLARKQFLDRVARATTRTCTRAWPRRARAMTPPCAPPNAAVAAGGVPDDDRRAGTASAAQMERGLAQPAVRQRALACRSCPGATPGRARAAAAQRAAAADRSLRDARPICRRRYRSRSCARLRARSRVSAQVTDVGPPMRSSHASSLPRAGASRLRARRVGARVRMRPPRRRARATATCWC